MRQQMFSSLGRKRNLILLCIGVVAAISLLRPEPTKDFLKSVPGAMELLALTHNSLTPPMSPEDLGSGSHATQILFTDPAGVAQDAGGNLYISDRGGVIWQIDASGLARVIAGTGRRGRAREGQSAIDTDLGAPQGIAFDSLNRLHIADSFNNVVVRIENDGTVTRVAGTGFVGATGDGVPAKDASLDEPFDICFDSKDNLYIVEFGNNRVRKVDQRGIISTIAGTREPGYSGDGGPATSALLRGPYGAFVDGNDRLYIADSGNDVIRMVDKNGIISSVAGGKSRGYAGDGGPAIDALLDSPQFLVVDDDGRMIVGDEHNRAIRVISSKGIISTLIGGMVVSGNPSEPPDSVLNDPEALLLQPDGSLLIVDGGNARVIRLQPDGSIEHFAGRPPAGSQTETG